MSPQDWDHAAEIATMSLEEAAEKRPSLKEKLDALTAAVKHAEKYPECAKLSTHHNDILELQRFLDWCEEENVDQVVLGKRDTMGEVDEIHGRERELLIYKYFEIDPKKLEDERRAMLDEQRKLNEETK